MGMGIVGIEIIGHGNDRNMNDSSRDQNDRNVSNRNGNDRNKSYRGGNSSIRNRDDSNSLSSSKNKKTASIADLLKIITG